MAISKITQQGLEGVDATCSNVALGNGALDDGSLTGQGNTAVGSSALTANTSGNFNDAHGWTALSANTTGGSNVAFGNRALASNTTASNNTAVGVVALTANTTGAQNTAVGTLALDADTTGSNNTAVGYGSLTSNTVGGENTAIGVNSGAATTGSSNTFIGRGAGETNNTGGANTYVGRDAGGQMTTGNNNTIIGRYNGNQGGLDIRTSSGNIVLSDGDGNPRSYYDDTCKRWSFEAFACNNLGYVLRQKSVCNPYGIYLQFSCASPDNNTQYFIETLDEVTARFRVYSDGDVVNHDNSYGGISDEKLKEQIIDSPSQWEDIKAITVRKYKMKSDVASYGDSDAHWRLGVIAQEAEVAGLSGLIKESPDRDPETLEDLGTTTKQIKYSILYMKAVKALQEAMERIETLEAKVEALENA